MKQHNNNKLFVAVSLICNGLLFTETLLQWYLKSGALPLIAVR